MCAPRSNGSSIIRLMPAERDLSSGEDRLGPARTSMPTARRMREANRPLRGSSVGDIFHVTNTQRKERHSSSSAETPAPDRDSGARSTPEPQHGHTDLMRTRAWWASPLC
ncbi:hypothetical protein GJAV_G00080910 [Gymnothorax javanicus]|nr:hypothetical protein GJAV_G00080910 [Gymnothorax javanicus]